MKIGIKDVNKISGPVSVCVLKPSKHTHKEYEENGGRAPYIILFGDHHFEREGECDNCNCEIDWTVEDDEIQSCCYSIENPEFLKLFDNSITPLKPIDLFVEQAYEVNIGDPDIEEKNIFIQQRDNTGFMANFLHQYNICYSKEKRGTDEYIKKCPTKYMRWHYNDVRYLSKSAKTYDYYLMKGVHVFQEQILEPFFDPLNMITGIDVKEECDKVVNKYRDHLKIAFSMFFNGPQFVKSYMHDNGNFLLVKQVKKQTLPRLRNMSWWHTFIEKTAKRYFEDYKDFTWMTNENYYDIIAYFVDIFTLVLSTSLSKLEFNIRRFDILKNVVVKPFSPYVTQIGKGASAFDIYNHTVGSLLVDSYTLGRIFKLPSGGTPSFLSMVYIGDMHAKNIKNCLIEDFGYELVGESRNNPDNTQRCIDVSNIDFNLLKVKNEYK